MNTDPPASIFLVVDQNGSWVSDAFGTRVTAEQEAKANDNAKLTHRVLEYKLVGEQMDLEGLF